MLKKHEEPEKNSQPLGEDFDIFPDLDSMPPEWHEQMEEEEPIPSQEVEIEEEKEPEPTQFQKKIAAIPENKWKMLQIIAGIIIGLAGCAILVFLGNTETFSGITIIMAIIVAFILPRTFTTQAKRSTKIMQRTILFTVIGCLLIYLFYGLVLHPGLFSF